MTFSEVIETAANNLSAVFTRSDYRAQWAIRFCPDTGELQQSAMSTGVPFNWKKPELYIHDFVDGEWAEVTVVGTSPSYFVSVDVCRVDVIGIDQR